MFIKAKVTAGVKKEAILRLGEDSFRISVKEPAERNLANKRVMELIAGHFKVPVGKVRLVNGHHSPSKILSINIEL